MNKLNEIKDYLPFVLEEPAHSHIEWLIKIVEGQQKELSLLCPIADMPVIESLKIEKIYMMEKVKELEEKVKQYENVIHSIANIDTIFYNPDGTDREWSDKEALEEIEKLVMPIWNEHCKKSWEKHRQKAKENR